MAENRVEANAHNAGGCPASNAIHGHINDFLVRTGLRSGVSELQLPCFTAVRAEIALMSGGAFAVTHHPVSRKISARHFAGIFQWMTGICTENIPPFNPLTDEDN